MRTAETELPDLTNYRGDCGTVDELIKVLEDLRDEYEAGGWYVENPDGQVAARSVRVSSDGHVIELEP